MTFKPAMADLVARARRLTTGPRRVLGLTGPPGAGKSTLAAALADALGPAAALVGMDGFHLAEAELRRLGRHHRKGAPDTFDVAGYVALLRRLREAGPEAVYAPAFDRRLEEPVAGAIRVEPATPLVVTEGNYLLLPADGWQHVRPLLDEVWYVDADPGQRVDRLIQRHVRHGKSPGQAQEWVMRSDEANTPLIVPTRERADLVITETIIPEPAH